ncbi:MAG: hypothetical protein ACRCWQ_10710 [Bacilli bacterium]
MNEKTQRKLYRFFHVVLWCVLIGLVVNLPKILNKFQSAEESQNRLMRDLTYQTIDNVPRDNKMNYFLSYINMFPVIQAKSVVGLEFIISPYVYREQDEVVLYIGKEDKEIYMEIPLEETEFGFRGEIKIKKEWQKEQLYYWVMKKSSNKIEIIDPKKIDQGYFAYSPKFEVKFSKDGYYTQDYMIEIIDRFVNEAEKEKMNTYDDFNPIEKSIPYECTFQYYDKKKDKWLKTEKEYGWDIVPHTADLDKGIIVTTTNADGTPFVKKVPFKR